MVFFGCHNLVEAERNSRGLLLANKLLSSSSMSWTELRLPSKRASFLDESDSRIKAKHYRQSGSMAKKAAHGLIHGNTVLAEAELHLGLLYLKQMKNIRLVLLFLE